jgi:hypothetical protein
MKKLFFLTILTCVYSISPVIAGVLVLEGNFQGKNLYVKNPLAVSGVGFCIFEVTVNGQVTTDETNSSAFEIDFAPFQLNIGDPVVVKIKHKDDCKPSVLNPEVLKPKSTFEMVSIKVEKDGTLNWTTKNETGKLPFVIEQYRWNKWVKVAEVEGKGTPGTTEYSAKVVPHSGENKFRIKQTDFTSKPRYSDEVKLRSLSPEVTFSPQPKVDKEILFSAETMYEIFDSYGVVVKKGYGSKVDVSSLKKGEYYINYDSKDSKFSKK